MKKVKINKDGFLESIYINDATIEIEVDDEGPYYDEDEYRERQYRRIYG